jgi:hypothetical protein
LKRHTYETASYERTEIKKITLSGCVAFVLHLRSRALVSSVRLPIFVTLDFPTSQRVQRLAQAALTLARRIFTGGAKKKPKELGGDDAIVRFVASPPDTIGHIDSTKTNKSGKFAK